MQVRCTYCRMTFSLSREDILYALNKIEQDNLKFFNFACPSCRRANRVNASRLQKALPNWRSLLAAEEGEEAA